MRSLFRIFLLGARLVVASIVALCMQIAMVAKLPDHLLLVQEQVKAGAVNAFALSDIQSQYQVAYNLIGGDNILVHMLFVLIAYLLILILLLPFNRKPKTRYRYSG